MTLDDEFLEYGQSVTIELCAGERLDVYLSGQLGVTRSFVQGMLTRGEALVNEKPQKAGYKLRQSDRISVVFAPPTETEILPEDIPLDVVYEDEYIIVVNKPQGMVVHPAPGNYTGTLVNALLFYVKDLAGIGGQLRPGIVHRIDKDTSGLLVVAKNDKAHVALSEQIKTHAAGRLYLAIVEGNFKDDEGAVNAPIGRSPKDRKKMAVVAGGREALTHYRVLERFGDFTLIECRLETGRTHQIRVHMAHVHHPVAGDAVYGPQKQKLGLSAQALHACELHLKHPATGQSMVFTAPPPPSFVFALKKLRDGAR